MTLDEAIEVYKHASYESVGDAMEARQLAEWLRQARGADKAARWYTAKIRELENRSKALETLIGEKEAENERLRELVAHYERAVTVHDVKPVEVLEWSVRCDALRRELGIEVEDDA